jgi:hypothetical protein
MAIKEDCKTAGQLYYATGGRHLNANEFFKASRQILCPKEIEPSRSWRRARRIC